MIPVQFPEPHGEAKAEIGLFKKERVECRRPGEIGQAAKEGF